MDINYCNFLEISLFKKKKLLGVPVVVQWDKNPTAEAPVAVEGMIRSLAQCSGLK